MNVKKIGVIGAGQMGHGIALVAAQAGFNVIIRDIEKDYVEKGIGRIEKFLSKSVEKGKMEETEKKKIMSRISGTTKLQVLKDVDLIIEAIFENVQVKKELFKELDNICKKDTYLAKTNSFTPDNIIYHKEKIGKKYAVVQTKVIVDKDTEIPIFYKLIYKDNMWLVCDIAIEGVSLIKNYYEQFNEIIQNSSFDELLKQLEAKKVAGGIEKDNATKK